MSENYMSFEGFRAATEQATVAIVRPYGIYYKGQTFWHWKLMKKSGHAVRFFEDNSGPMLSLGVLDLDGNFLCIAWPPAWDQRDHEIFRTVDF